MIELISTILYLQVNLYRVQNTALFVNESPQICKMAEIRLEKIKKDFSHSGLKSDFLKVFSKEDVGYENLGRIEGNDWIKNEARILELWKLSEKHNRNLLRDLDEMCIRTDGNYYVLEGVKYGK